MTEIKVFVLEVTWGTSFTLDIRVGLTILNLRTLLASLLVDGEDVPRKTLLANLLRVLYLTVGNRVGDLLALSLIKEKARLTVHTS